jgi:hypothetical protein
MWARVLCENERLGHRLEHARNLVSQNLAH